MYRLVAILIAALLALPGFVAPLTASANPSEPMAPNDGPCIVDDGEFLRYQQQEVGPDRVYFPQTGHHVGDPFLRYWRHSGGLYQFGYPLTEELEEDGLTVQYFERAVFEYHQDNAPEWRILLRRLGADQTADRRDEAQFQPVEAADDRATRYFPQTAHRLSHGFRTYWENNGGLYIFGYPISEEFEEGGYTVQYFERARFEWHPELRGTRFEILLGHLGRQAAAQAGVDTSPVDRKAGVDNYSPDLWYIPAPPPPPPPTATAPPGAPTHLAKWIEVDLTNQRVRAWEYSRVVYTSLASTGRPAVPTLRGTFRIYVKYQSTRMSGWTPDGGYYDLPNVPYVMYYDRGYGIHGTYWHSNFGTPMSAGCVNLPTSAAGWMFNWAPIGTTVYIHGRTPGT
jgi:lipoprotein-anchoring transpeptidase ErfK/SrfK